MQHEYIAGTDDDALVRGNRQFCVWDVPLFVQKKDSIHNGLGLQRDVLSHHVRVQKKDPEKNPVCKSKCSTE